MIVILQINQIQRNTRQGQRDLLVCRIEICNGPGKIVCHFFQACFYQPGCYAAEIDGLSSVIPEFGSELFARRQFSGPTYPDSAGNL